MPQNWVMPMDGEPWKTLGREYIWEFNQEVNHADEHSWQKPWQKPQPNLNSMHLSCKEQLKVQGSESEYS